MLKIGPIASMLLASTCCILLLGGAFILNPELRYGPPGNGIDVWEYQTVAVNLAEFGKFPVMGYLADEQLYQLNQLPSTAIEDYFKCRFTAHGPVHYVGKPPLYGLTLGLVYAMFGIHLKSAYYLNVVFLFAISGLLICLGHYINRTKGWLLGLASSTVYVLSVSQALSDILPAFMLTFICCSIALVAVRLQQTNLIRYYALLGALFGIGMLVKGNIIFIVALFPLYLLIQQGLNKQSLARFGILLLSGFMVLLPWMIYANMIRWNSSAEWGVWKKSIIQAESLCEFDTLRIENWQSKENRKSVVRNQEHHKVVSHIYSRSADSSIPIIISNQATSDEMLSVHNEFTVDGDWHPEWRFRETAIYNQRYLDSAYLLKIVRFYCDNPTLLYEIAMAKLLRTTSGMFSFFLFAAYTFGCLACFQRLNPKKIILQVAWRVIAITAFLVSLFCFPVAHVILTTLVFFIGLVHYLLKPMPPYQAIFGVILVNGYLTVWVFYGHARFVDVIEPLAIFSALYSIAWMMNTTGVQRIVSRVRGQNDSNQGGERPEG